MLLDCTVALSFTNSGNINTIYLHDVCQLFRFIQFIMYGVLKRFGIIKEINMYCTISSQPALKPQASIMLKIYLIVCPDF